MASLYTKNSTISKLYHQFSKIFSKETNPTVQHLFQLVLSVFALNGFPSVKYNFEHFIHEISDSQLKSFYYTLNESKILLSDWMKNLIHIVLSLFPNPSKQPVVLAIDDTLVEKFGKKFEHCSKLFDHAAHNGSNYLNGHCFVSLLLSVPVQNPSDCRYLSFPVAYRMWTKVQTKLELASTLVKSAMSCLGTQRQIILCCDSWYPKGCVKDLVNYHENLTMICNVRSDTAIYEIPPARTGKKGRPRMRGKRLSPEQFDLKEIPGSNWMAGCKPVMTMLFGKRMVYAIVTKPKDGKTYRLFLCTQDPKELNFDLAFVDQNAAVFANTDSNFLPLTIYALRWNIEVSYYEQKTFWGLEDYRLRSQTGMERLINLLTLCYASMKLLPYLSQDFQFLKGLSAQQARFELGKQIRQEVFFATFVERLETDKNNRNLVELLKSQWFSLLSAA